MAESKLPTEEELANGRKPKAGDLVSIVFSAQTEEGELLQAMDDMEEPIRSRLAARRPRSARSFSPLTTRCRGWSWATRRW